MGQIPAHQKQGRATKQRHWGRPPLQCCAWKHEYLIKLGVIPLISVLYWFSHMYVPSYSDNVECFQQQQHPKSVMRSGTHPVSSSNVHVAARLNCAYFYAPHSSLCLNKATLMMCWSHDTEQCLKLKCCKFSLNYPPHVLHFFCYCSKTTAHTDVASILETYWTFYLSAFLTALLSFQIYTDFEEIRQEIEAETDRMSGNNKVC